MKYKTCVSIAQKTPRGLKKIVKKALKKSDYVEIRFDFLKPAEVPKALELLKNDLKKSVCTLRPKSEGGKFSGVEKERIAILKLIAEYNPFLLDVEFNSLKKNKTLVKYLKKTKTPILVSWHDFKKTPNIATLNRVLEQMSKFSKNIKIVTNAKTIVDPSYVLSLYGRASSLSLIAFAMGDFGRMSRLSPMFHLGNR